MYVQINFQILCLLLKSKKIYSLLFEVQSIFQVVCHICTLVIFAVSKIIKELVGFNIWVKCSTGYSVEHTDNSFVWACLPYKQAFYKPFTQQPSFKVDTNVTLKPSTGELVIGRTLLNNVVPLSQVTRSWFFTLATSSQARIARSFSISFLFWDLWLTDVLKCSILFSACILFYSFINHPDIVTELYWRTYHSYVSEHSTPCTDL